MTLHHLKFGYTTRHMHLKFGLLTKQLYISTAMRDF